jgi:ferredoxin
MELLMRVSIDQTRCQGHTLCHITVPDLFRLRDEDGHAFVEDSVVPSALEEGVRRAELGCPERAIRVEE